MSLARGKHGLFESILQCVPRHTATRIAANSGILPISEVERMKLGGGYGKQVIKVI